MQYKNFNFLTYFYYFIILKLYKRQKYIKN